MSLQALTLRSVRFIAKWPSLVPAALSIAMFACAFVAGILSGVSGSASHLPASLYGFTAVLSSQALGLEGHPYSGYQSVEEALKRGGMEAIKENIPQIFRNPMLLNSVLQQASVAETCGSPLVFNSNNDQGIVDYIRGAFWMFGMNVRALYYFYFVVLVVPVLLFLLAFWRDYLACALLFACMFAVYAFMPSWIFQVDDLMSVANQRFLSTIGIVPLLHILMMISRKDCNSSWPDIATITGQAIVVSFAYAVRSTTEWMFVAVAALTLFCLAKPLLIAIRVRTLRAVGPFAIHRASVALLFAATVLTVGAVRMLYLTPACGTALNAHPIWHTLYFGLQWGPKWGSKTAPYIGLARNEHRPNPVPRIDDESLVGDEIVYEAVKQYVIRHHLPYNTEPNIWYATAQSEQTTAEPMPFGSWVIYERLVRDMFLEFAWEHPRYLLENFLVVKPRHFIDVLARFFLAVWRDLSVTRAIAFGAMVLIIAAFWLTGKQAKTSISFMTMMLLLLFSFGVSLAPLLAHSNPHLISDQAYIALVWIVLLLIRSVAAALSYGRKLMTA
jgi:hypothetical protein